MSDKIRRPAHDIKVMTVSIKMQRPVSHEALEDDLLRISDLIRAGYHQGEMHIFDEPEADGWWELSWG